MYDGSTRSAFAIPKSPGYNSGTVKRLCVALGVLLCVSSLALAQSLGDVAKKEKERREKNKKEGAKAQTITEEDLAAGRDLEQDIAVIDAASSESSDRRGSGSEFNEEDLEDVTLSSNIPADLPLQERLQFFDALKRAYQRQVAEIDEELSKNKQRLTEIEREAAAIAGSGASGIPVAPNPNQANQAQMTGQEGMALAKERESSRARTVSSRAERALSKTR